MSAGRDCDGHVGATVQTEGEYRSTNISDYQRQWPSPGISLLGAAPTFGLTFCLPASLVDVVDFIHDSDLSALNSATQAYLSLK